MMGKRRITAAAAVAILALSACGSDGPSALSEDDFLSTLSDVCSTAQESFDELDTPTDLAGVEATAKSSIKILKKVKSALADVVAPDTYARDFTKFQSLVDDEIDAFTELRDAANDGDQAAAEAASTDLSGYLEDQAGLADDLDSDDCSGESGSTPPTTPPTESTPAESTPAVASIPVIPGITEAPATVAPTLPPVNPPVITTLPPVITTIASVTIPQPVLTTAPASGSGITLDSVTANFAAPVGYVMNDTTSDIASSILAGFSTDPTLGTTIDLLGIADLVDGSGIVVARLFIAFTADGGVMPQAWSDYFCSGTGAPSSTPGGFDGVQCTLDDGSGGTQNFFALQGGTAGFALLTVDPNLDLPGLVDAFFDANPGD